MNINRNHNFRRNNNISFRRNGSSNNSQKDELREHVEEFKEVFVKEKDLSSSYVVVVEQYFDAPDNRLKSTVVCDSSYLN